MYLADVEGDYLAYIRNEQGVTERTYIHYQSRLRHFRKWLAEEEGLAQPQVEDIRTEVVRRYLYWLGKQGLRPRTIRGYMGALRSLFTFTIEQGLLEESPVHRVRMPKKDAARRLVPHEEEIQALWQAAGNQANRFRAARDKAILAVLIFGGQRRQEVFDLRVADVDLSGQLLHVYGKGQKYRQVYLGEEAVQTLREWLRVRPECQHHYLFCVDPNRRIGEEALYALLEEAKARAGLAGNPAIKPHSLRHAAASRALANGADLRSIQAWLGHSQLTTTAQYLHLNEQQAKRVGDLASFQGGHTGAQEPQPQTAPPPDPTPVEDALKAVEEKMAQLIVSLAGVLSAEELNLALAELRRQREALLLQRAGR